VTIEHRDQDAGALGSRAIGENMYVSLATFWPYLSEIIVMVPRFLHSRKGLYSEHLLVL